MGLWRLVERFFSSCRLEVALAVPIAVFIVLNLLAQIVILSLWGSDQPIALWEWSSVVLPIFAFIVAFGIAIVAVVGQLKRTGWWRLLQSDHSFDAIRSRLPQLPPLPRVRRRS